MMQSEVLAPAARKFITALHRRFNGRRRELLAARQTRQAQIDAGELPGFLAETTEIRRGGWQVAPAPADLADRRVEITGPVDRKMMINALNSGAKVFMADFEDSHTPRWDLNLEGQRNLQDAVAGKIRFEAEGGRVYELGDDPAVLMVRPRGWHLEERHFEVDGSAIAASFFDFGLYLFHNAEALLERGTGPYFYLPKLESHLEARLWNDVFLFAQGELGLRVGTIRATVLIETILAAFEMEEILYELRQHSAGLNAGRWDYIFSLIKKFRGHPERVLPDRGQVTMSVPFMQAYSEFLVKTCHKRGVHAIGGMAAFIPSRRDADVNERAFAKVREDKIREAKAGYDGTWVAHPGLVPVAQAVFDSVLGNRPNQIDRKRDDVRLIAPDLLDTTIKGASVTERGLQTNVSVGIQYLASWLRGHGAAGLFNLMEDAATAEISRSQLWQWVRHGATTDDGVPVTRDRVLAVIAEEMASIEESVGSDAFARGRYGEAAELFEQVALSDDFVEFLTHPAYELLEART